MSNLNLRKSAATKIMSKEKEISVLKDALEIQCKDGNWNWNPYMHGMANGIIFALSVIENEHPHFIDAPDIWLQDVSDGDTTEPVEAEILPFRKPE